MKYSEYRILRLKELALEAYAELPEEIKHKSIPEAIKYKQEVVNALQKDKPSYEEKREIRNKEFDLSLIYKHFFDPLIALVDKGTIDFDKDAPLEEIVKLLQ